MGEQELTEVGMSWRLSAISGQRAMAILTSTSRQDCKAIRKGVVEARPIVCCIISEHKHAR